MTLADGNVVALQFQTTTAVVVVAASTVVEAEWVALAVGTQKLVDRNVVRSQLTAVNC